MSVSIRDQRTITIEGEAAASLKDRLLDAEQMWRYFCRRDEMNAEIHLDENNGKETDASRFARVRYSPITIASERVVGWLAQAYYGEEVDYRTALVESGGVPLAVAYTHEDSKGS